MPRTSRAGFTLVELMLSLALSGMVLVTCTLMIRQLDVTHTTIQRHAARVDASANGARLLRDVFDRVELSADSARQFYGDAHYVSLPTWCDMPGGWLERCVANVALDQRGDSTGVTVQFSDNTEQHLITVVGPATFGYLGWSADGLTWTTMWGRSLMPPIAIGIVRHGVDTLVIRLGERS